MALRLLSTGVMVSLSKALIDAKHDDHKALVAIDEVSGLVPRLSGATERLLHVQSRVRPRQAPARLKEIFAASRLTDLRHDELVRGVHGCATGAAAIVKNPELKKLLLELAAALFPDGLSITQKSYREEAGAAELAKASLTDPQRALLRKVRTPDGTLLDAVEEWIQTGETLGRLEDERATLEAPDGVTPAEVITARNEWIRVVNAIRGSLTLVEPLPSRVVAVLKRIEEAEEKAKQSPADEEDPPSDPSATSTTPV